MNKNVLIASVVFVALMGLGFFFANGDSVDQRVDGVSIASGEDVVLHKSPTCGCCGVYGSYLGRLDYNVEIHDTNNLSLVKSELGVPQELESCHTMEITLSAQAGGYVVEGHVPEEAIQKLLAEKPDIKGIGMAGMPSGSPGMPGPKMGDFVIYEITHEGTKGDVFLTL